MTAEASLGQVAGAAALVPPATTAPSRTPGPTDPPGPTSTPIAQDPWRLTEAGCCLRPFWSPDSRWVAFIDRPQADRPAGIYAVSIEGGPPQLTSQRPGLLSASWTVMLYEEAGRVYVERVADGERWPLPEMVRSVMLSPSGQAIAWTTGSQGITHPDLRERIVWLAGADGSGIRQLIRARGGAIVGWGEGEEHLIISGQVEPDGPAGLWRVEPENGRAVLLVEAAQPRDVLISPSGGWLAFYNAFDTGPGENGLSLVRTDGSRVFQIGRFGAYRWRSEAQLLLIPLEASGQTPLRLLQIEAETGTISPIRIDGGLPEISGNEWQPSPDGRLMVYLSPTDQSLWALALPSP